MLRNQSTSPPSQETGEVGLHEFPVEGMEPFGALSEGKARRRAPGGEGLVSKFRALGSEQNNERKHRRSCKHSAAPQETDGLSSSWSSCHICFCRAVARWLSKIADLRLYRCVCTPVEDHRVADSPIRFRLAEGHKVPGRIQLLFLRVFFQHGTRFVCLFFFFKTGTTAFVP